MRKISASSLQTYIQCPRKFKVLKIDREDVDDYQIYFEYGTLIHDTIEKAIKENKLENAHEYFTEKWQDIKINDLETFKKGKNALNNTIEYLYQYDGKEKVAEYAFDGVEISDKVSLIGRIDLIVFLEDALKIIDFKTGMWAKTTLQVNSDVQLGIYDLVASKVFGIDNIHTALFYCEKGEVAPDPTNIFQHNRAEFTEFLNTTVDKIDKDTEFKPILNTFCPNCAIKNNCDAYKNAHNCGDYKLETVDDAIKLVSDLSLNIKILQGIQDDAKAFLKTRMLEDGIDKIKSEFGSCSMTQRSSDSYNATKFIELCKENKVGLSKLPISSEFVKQVISKHPDLEKDISSMKFSSFGDPYLMIRGRS